MVKVLKNMVLKNACDLQSHAASAKGLGEWGVLLHLHISRRRVELDKIVNG
jgi:hypothetical protein